MSASMAFLKAMLAAQGVTKGLTNYHGVVKDFMHELFEEVRNMRRNRKR
jgi:hypothetical protein